MTEYRLTSWNSQNRENGRISMVKENSIHGAELVQVVLERVIIPMPRNHIKRRGGAEDFIRLINGRSLRMLTVVS